jgi:hypothetical protein
MSKNNLQLFENIHRDYIGPSKRIEPHWIFFNRSARPQYEYLRECLQAWFDEYDASAEKRSDLRLAFQSDNNKTHLSAFFELYLYQLFRKQGFEIEIEPDWNQRRPDFLLTAPTGQKILLEATGSYPESQFGGAKQLEETILDYLDDNLDSPDFFIGIQNIQSTTNPPNRKQMLHFFQQQLEELDYNQQVESMEKSKGLHHSPSFTWEQKEWSITFSVTPKMDARGKTGIRPIGYTFLGISIVDTAANIKSRINEKYNRYGELEIPFLLALNVIDPFFDKESFLDAIFGQETLIISRDTNETTRQRLPNGAWFAPKGYQKQRMSAICVFNQLYPETIHSVDAVIWHHPYANNPFPSELFSLTQHIPNLAKGEYERKDGIHPNEFLEVNAERMRKPL